MAVNETIHKKLLVQTVVRRFPDAEFAIWKLMDRNLAFRDMCEELVEAEGVLSRFAGASLEVHEAQRTEWQGFVDRLVDEIRDALTAASRAAPEESARR